MRWGMGLLIIAMPFSSHTAVCANLNIESFVKRYVELNESARLATLELTKGEQRRRLGTNFYKSQLTLIPAQDHKEQIFEDRTTRSSFDFYEQRTHLTGAYTQDLPIGLQMDLKGQEYFASSNPNLSVIDRDYSVSFRQSVWRNAFGRRTHLLRSQWEHQLRALDLQRMDKIAEICFEAMRIYSEAFEQQERVRVQQSIFQTSSQALQIAETGFKNRLLRRLDLLSARSDHLVQEETLKLEQSQLEVVLSRIQISLLHPEELPKAMEQAPLSLSAPTSWFAKVEEEVLKTIADESTESLQLQKAQAELQASEAQKVVIVDQQRSRIDLGLGVGYREGRMLSQSSLSDYSENYVRLFLEMEWPVFSQSPTAERRLGVLNVMEAQIEATRRSRSDADLAAQSSLDLDRLRQQIYLSERRLALRNDEVMEAFALFRSGRLEFDDYLRYRDRQANDQMRLLRLTQEKQKVLADVARLRAHSYSLCNGGTNGYH